MIYIEVSKVWDLHKYAEKTYELGQRAPTQEFDSAVGHLIRCWDDLCNFLEELGRETAERRETYVVKGLNEAKALGMTKAAVNAIDSTRKHHNWEYRGDLPNERERLQSDAIVGGLQTLKGRFNEFLEQERRYRRAEITFYPLPDPLPSPVSFEIRDGAVHMAPHSTPALPDERRAGAESAWIALKELLADLAASPARQNHPSIDRVLDRCRSALGDEFQQLNVIMLGVHASRVDQITLRADEILMPGDAADLVAFNAQLGLFLGQFPDWIEYARGIDDPFGSDGAEQKAVSDASAAVRAMREKAPNLLAPDATDALKGLEEDATPETDVDGPSAFAPPNSRRSYLRASRDLLLKLFSAVIIDVEKIMKRNLRAMIIDALSAASTWLIALATGLLSEFGWLTGIGAYLARIFRTSSIERTENDNDTSSE